MKSKRNYNDFNEVGMNEYLRNRIDKNFFSNNTKSYGVEFEFMNSIINSINSEEKENEFYANSVLSVLFMDTYKMLSNKVKDLDASEEDILLYTLLSSLKNIDEVKKVFLGSKELFLKSFEYSKEFFNQTSLSKIKIVKKLTSYENDHLTKITPLHLLDIEKYNKKIDKDFIYNYYKNQTDYLFSKSGLNSFSAVSIMISNFLKDMYYISYEDISAVLDSIYKDVFNNFGKLESNNIDAIKKSIESLSNIYNVDNNTFVEISIMDVDILENMLECYFILRDSNLIKNKELKKD